MEKKNLIASDSIISVSYLSNVGHTADFSEEQHIRKMASSAIFFFDSKKYLKAVNNFYLNLRLKRKVKCF